MEQIKIGNDVKINISIPGNIEFSRRNIRTLRCYFVNTTQFNNVCECECDKYLLNVCGRPSYHVLPRNKYFKEFVCARDLDKINPKLLKHDKTKYLAESYIDPDSNTISVYFPAKDQIVGVYKLIVIVESYVPGWGEKQIKTSTFEYKDVIEITENADYSLGDVTVITGSDLSKYQGYVGFLDVRPYDTTDESDDKGFNRTDDSFESSDQESYTKIGASNVDLNKLTEVSDLSIPTNVSNTSNGTYLWVVSKTPIESVYANSFLIPITNPTSGGKEGLYYYASSNPVAKVDNISINVKFGQLWQK